MREFAEDNLYARPLEGLVVLVDIQRGVVAHFEDARMVPVPPRDQFMNYHAVEDRQGVKPLHVVQPHGPSFTIDDQNRVR